MGTEENFYKFRKKCKNGVLINNKYSISIKELKDKIDNIVEELIELDNDRWIIVLDKESANENNIIHIEKI